ncbi:MAG TPA: hypothetical protein VF533_04195 [Solirubrobacteraceae bacterium]|jgi:hypothetical protein
MPLFRRPSTGTVLGSIALFVALGGTALAATGQLVNIADGTNSARIAHVDVNGALKTSGLTTIAAPARVFSVESAAYDDDTQSYTPLFSASTATIAINRIVVAPTAAATVPRDLQIYYFSVAPGKPCSENGLYDYRYVVAYRINTETVVDTFPTPLVFKPQSGRPWCLSTFQTRRDADNTTVSRVTVSGSVLYGTAPAGTSPTAAAAAPSSDERALSPGEKALREAVAAR